MPQRLPRHSRLPKMALGCAANSEGHPSLASRKMGSQPTIGLTGQWHTLGFCLPSATEDTCWWSRQSGPEQD